MTLTRLGRETKASTRKAKQKQERYRKRDVQTKHAGATYLFLSLLRAVCAGIPLCLARLAQIFFIHFAFVQRPPTFRVTVYFPIRDFFGNFGIREIELFEIAVLKISCEMGGATRHHYHRKP